MRGKAEQFGVTEIYIDDLREEFVRDFVFPMFRCSPIVQAPSLLQVQGMSSVADAIY